MNLPWLAL